jgi:hypothetical protein
LLTEKTEADSAEKCSQISAPRQHNRSNQFLRVLRVPAFVLRFAAKPK